ncbi:MAG: 50S ribosomal protein L6 [Kiritimatiellia bacterium]|jgi:large subunit ribosomal protein L6
MSRIGKNPIEVKAGVTVEIKGQDVAVKGKLGELAWRLPDGISASLDNGVVKVARSSEEREQKAFHGLARSLIENMIVGVSDGYSKSLDIEGVGFKAESRGASIFLSLGFANAKEYKIPDGAKVTVQNQGLRILVEGIDKQLVGRVAADIRAYFPAEPYKGKGIRYTDEKIRRKEGKTVA